MVLGQVQDLWGNPAINSGGGLWDPPSFDRQGNLYIGIANPGPIGQSGWPRGYPWGTSLPGPDLYTDSVVKLSPAGNLPWYYQLTPHDLFDWDLQNSPVLTTANGQPVVIDGGKAGILIELNAHTGKPLWNLPVGVHSGPAGAGLLTQNATPSSPIRLPTGSSASSPACSAASSPSWPPTAPRLRRRQQSGRAPLRERRDGELPGIPGLDPPGNRRDDRRQPGHLKDRVDDSSPRRPTAPPPSPATRLHHHLSVTCTCSTRSPAPSC